jgi:hypothetical protein
MNHLVRLATDQALVSVGRIREAWPWLALAAIPGPVRHVERHLTDRARAALNRLVHAERGERVLLARHGLTPALQTPDVARIDPLDARTEILSTLTDTAWLVTSSLHRTTRRPYRPAGDTADAKAVTALDYLAGALEHVTSLPTAETAVRLLDQADHRARAAAGVGSDRRMLKAECPACGRRSLHADVGSPNYREWAITCTRPDCRCSGVGCPCNRPNRYPGTRHVWMERDWATLGRLLDRQDVA